MKKHLFRFPGEPDGVVEEMTVREFLALNPDRKIIVEYKDGTREEIPVGDEVLCDMCSVVIVSSLFILDGYGHCQRCFRANLAPYCTPIPEGGE